MTFDLARHLTPRERLNDPVRIRAIINPLRVAVAESEERRARLECELAHATRQVSRDRAALNKAIRENGHG